MTFPVPIRLCLALRPKIMARALEITHAAISSYYCKKEKLPKAKSKAGAVTLIQRFGGSLNLNVHFHQLFIDGAYQLGDQGEPIDFYTSLPPTLSELDLVLGQIIKRLTKYLVRQKIIVNDIDNDQEFQLEIPAEDSFAKLQASSVTYRFATGPNKGKKAMVLKTVPENDHTTNWGLVVKNSGFSLHAGVATKAHERDELERICRYIARPAVSEERLSINHQNEVIYKFKKATACETVQFHMWPSLGRRHHCDKADTNGVYGKTCGSGSSAQSSPHQIPRGFGTALQIPQTNCAAKKRKSTARAGNWRGPGRHVTTTKSEAHIVGKVAKAGLQHRHHELPKMPR